MMGWGTKKGQVNYSAPLQPRYPCFGQDRRYNLVTLASVKTWGIGRELAV